MPICNIIDGRKNHYDVNVMAIIEDSWHDNVCPNATQFPTSDDIVDYLGIRNTTIENVIKYATQEWPMHPLTLFLYDSNSNNHVSYETIVADDNKLYLLEKSTF